MNPPARPLRLALHQLIEAHAVSTPTAPALTHRDRTATYAELWADVRAAADGLVRLGLRRHDRVAVFLDKRPETVAAIFGTSLAGGAFVPVNPVLRPPQVGHIIRDCDVRVLVTTAERLRALDGELTVSPSVRHVVLVGDERTDDSSHGSSHDFSQDSSHDSPDGAANGGWDVAGDDVAVHPWSPSFTRPSGTALARASAPLVDLDMAAILYTSGSTGRPKGVVVTHRNLIVGAESVAAYLHNDSSDVILAALPISFDAGFSQLTTAFAVGAHAVLLNYLLPGDVVQACARHQVTGLTCVPPLWIQLAERPWPDAAARSMRYFANTGGRMPRTTLDSLRDRLPGADPYLMYGLTEAFRSTFLDPAEVDRRPDSIGKAIPNAEILVVRPDGSACGPGEAGELVHRGPLVTLGYWNDAARTAERFRPLPGEPLWRQPELAVWSGDTVVRDEEGFLYFVGRSDEMIKTSGYRVSPTEVEEALYDTGLVRDAVAFGVGDDVLGERIVAAIAPHGDGPIDHHALREHLRRNVPPYMIPSELVERAELPRSPNGKFDRAAVRTMIEAPA